MNKIRFAGKELEVTPLCLGTVDYGTAFPEKEAVRQLSLYTDLGGNFIDTAHVYGDWQPGWGPRSEIAIGKWLKEHGGRDKLVISTKGAHPALQAMHTPRLSDADIEGDLNASLEALGTDYVDLYFLHRDDPKRPAGEIVELLEKQVKAGKIRCYGCSNWTLPRIREANGYAKEHGLKGFAVNQLMWSLADINKDALRDDTLVPMDTETYHWMWEEGMSAMAYTALAKGYFSRRMAGKEIPPDMAAVYGGEVNEKIFALLRKACASGGCTPADYALQYIAEGHPFPAVPIVSCGSDEHLQEAVYSAEALLDPAVVKQLRDLKKR